MSVTPDAMRAPEPAQDARRGSAQSVYDFEANALSGRRVSLADFRGQALLVVNTASKCGFTPQYAGLEALHRSLSPRGFNVLGFPCDQFGHQEPGGAKEIEAFCATNYGLSFPMFAKIDVNGPDAHPLFAFLKRRLRGVLGTAAIKWNFTKFVIDGDGRPVSRHGSTTSPDALRPAIEALL